MKKLALLILLLCPFLTYGQEGNIQYLGGRNTYVVNPGMFSADSLFVLPTTDTTKAKESFSGRRLKGRVAFQGRVPYVYNGQWFDPLTDSTALQAIRDSLGAHNARIVALEEGGSAEAVWGSITGELPNQTDLQAALDSKQDALGFNPENSGNKQADTSLNGDATKYPNSPAVRTYVNNRFSGLQFSIDSAKTAIRGEMVNLTGTQTIVGKKTFSTTPDVPDDPYDATGWNGNNGVPTKNAIRDEMELVKTGVADSLSDHNARIVALEEAGGGGADSAVFATNYRVDTAKTKIRREQDSLFSLAYFSNQSIDNLPGILTHWDVTDAATVHLTGSNIDSVDDKGYGNTSAINTGFTPEYHASGGANNLAYAEIESGELFGQYLTYPFSDAPFTIYIVCRTPVLTDEMYVLRTRNGSGLTIQAASGENYYRQYTEIDPYYSQPLFGLTTDWTLIKITLKDAKRLWVEANNEVYARKQDAAGGSLIDNINTMAVTAGVDLHELIVFDREVNGITDDFVRNALIYKYKLPVKNKILCFGDSHVVGVVSGGGTPGGSMVQRINDSTSFRPYNWGANGSVVDPSGGTQTVGANLVDYVNLFNKNKFADTWLLFQYGTNDCAVFSQGHFTWDEWEDNYQAYIQTFIDAGYDRNKIIICTPPYSTGTYTDGELANCKAKIDAIATALDIHKVDLYAEMLALGEDTNDNPDHIHLNETQFSIWFGMVKAIIEP